MKRKLNPNASFAALLILIVPAARAWDFGEEAQVYWTPPAGLVEESNTLSAAAVFLTDTLSRMTQRTVALTQTEAEGRAGIHLIARAPAEPVTAQEVFSGRLEAYDIAIMGATLQITAPTAVGVRNGVMAFLNQQGCRWLLPSPKWWIVPQGMPITFDGHEASYPAFAYRRIWYAYGASSPELTGHYRVWCEANRLGGVALFQTGHSYDNIINRNSEEFAAHPEYFAWNPAPVEAPPPPRDPVDDLLEGRVATEPLVQPLTQPATATRSRNKFCFSNPELRALCLKDRLALLQANRGANPYAFMVSMDPSDGTGSCDCPDCIKIGTTTDRVVSLANHVARGLRAVDPGAWVGMYAYSSHRDPPTIAMEPNIHVQVAMAFNKGPHSYEDLIRLWGEKAGSLGIREYYGVEAWDFGMPGRIRGANPDYHAKWIPRYHAAGAVSLSAESNDNWGPQALGFYTAARLLWDPGADVESVQDEFLQAAFGAQAAVPMRKLYADFATRAQLSAISLSQMYELTDQALKVAPEVAVQARIVDLIAYLNYVHFFARFEACAAHSEPYYAALEKLMNYAHRIQPHAMVAVYALARRLCNANVKGKRDDLWLFGEHPLWRTGDPFTDAEILDQAAAIRENLRQAVAERPVYSRVLVPVTRLAGSRHPSGRELPFRHTAKGILLPGASGSYPFVLGPGVSVKIEQDAGGASVATFTSQAAGPTLTNAVELVAGTRYRLTLQTGKNTSTVTLPRGVAAAFEASPEQPLWLDSGAVFQIYVPAKTEELRCSGDPRLSLLDPSGQRTDVSGADAPGRDYTVVPVAEGQAGKLWTIWNQTRGRVAFYNVPPWVQLNPDIVLLPEDLPDARRVGN